MSWPQIVFGWPMIILAVGLFGAAFVRQRSRLGFIGLGAAAPFLWYASNAPNGLWYSTAVLLTLAAAAEFLRRGRRPWAAVCLAPFVGIVLILAAAVATQR